MFEKENRYYEENRDALREKYLGKAIAIVGDSVIGRVVACYHRV
jgi:hypothetical protein